MKPKTTVKNINATYNLDDTYPSSFHRQLLHINNLQRRPYSHTIASVEHMEQGHDHVKKFA